MRQLDITIVVATVGEKSLRALLDSLGQAVAVPREVILIYPPEMGFLFFPQYPFAVVNIRSERAGQVSQRIFGLQYVKTSMIMQVDSDIVFFEDTLFHVVEHLLKSGPGNVFSPQIRGDQQNAVNLGRSFYIKMLNYISDGQCVIPSMRLTKAGVPIIGTEPGGVDLDKTSVDWLNGVKAYWASDSIRVNYFPFEGKAYYEDVVQSIEFRARGAVLWQLKNVFIRHADSIDGESFASRFARLRALVWMVHFYGFDLGRFYTYIFLQMAHSLALMPIIFFAMLKRRFC